MKRILPLLAFVMLCLCTACSYHGPRVIEAPYFTAATSIGLKVAKVELTDTATFVTIDHEYYPHYWIKWPKSTNIIADGDTCRLIGGEGIVPDRKLVMPDSGDSTYTLIFEPVPYSAVSMDIVEDTVEGAFCIYDIDLTGKAVAREHRQLPAKVKASSIPDFVEDTGESTIRLHYLNWHPGLVHTATFVISELLQTQQREIEVPVGEDGTAECSFTQRGTASYFIGGGYVNTGNGCIAPGETVDVYFDLAAMGDLARNGSASEVRYEGVKGGRYACLQGVSAAVTMDVMSADAFPDLHMSADEYCDAVTAMYKSALDSLSKMNVAPVVRQYTEAQLTHYTLLALLQSSHVIGNDYRLKYRTEPDFKPAVIEKPQLERFLSGIDLDKESFISVMDGTSRTIIYGLDVNGVATGAWMRSWPPPSAMCRRQRMQH